MSKKSFHCPHCHEQIFMLKTEPPIKIQRYEESKLTPLQAEISIRFLRGEKIVKLAKVYDRNPTWISNLIKKVLRKVDSKLYWESGGTPTKVREKSAEYYINKIVAYSRQR